MAIREKLKTAKFPGSQHAVAEYVAEMVATIGENMTRAPHRRAHGQAMA